MPTILDTNQITTKQIVHLTADKILTVFRYLSAINPTGAKCVQEAEAQALAAAGVRLGLVNEGWGDFAHGGISAGAGQRDGQFCAQYAPSVGAPTGTCIYFAVDVDASSAQITKLVLPYFTSIKAAIANSGFVVGVYGSGAVCSTVVSNGLATKAWLSCSLGWTGSKDYLTAKPKELVLVQGLPTTWANLDCDPDTALGNIGDFVPYQPGSVSQV
jgi:hypothetical protein